TFRLVSGWDAARPPSNRVVSPGTGTPAVSRNTGRKTAGYPYSPNSRRTRCWLRSGSATMYSTTSTTTTVSAPAAMTAGRGLVRRGGPLGPRDCGHGSMHPMPHLSLHVIREALPATQRAAYLNAGSVGPLARAAGEAMRAQILRALEQGQIGPAAFEEWLGAY